MANRLTNLDVEFVSLVDRAAVRDHQNPAEAQKFLLWKSERGAPEDPTPEPQGGHMNPEELQAALEKAEQERDEAREAAEKAEGERDAAVTKAEDLEKAAEPDEPKVDALDKSELPEPVRKALEKAEADAAAANDRIQKAEDLAKAERDIRVNREFVAKAESTPGLHGDPAEVGPLMKQLSEAAPEAFEKFEKAVVNPMAAQVVASGIFKEHGRSGDTVPTETADDGLVTKAADLRKADSSLSESDAIARAIKDNPDLAASYLASVR